MEDSDFRPPGAPKSLNRSSWNLTWLITSNTPPHMPHAKIDTCRFTSIAISRTFYFFCLISWERLLSSPYNVAWRSMYHKTCFRIKYIPRASFRSKCQPPPPPPFIPWKPLFGSTSSLNQWTAFSRISWQPIKLSPRNFMSHFLDQIPIWYKFAKCFVAPLSSLESKHGPTGRRWSTVQISRRPKIKGGHVT